LDDAPQKQDAAPSAADKELADAEKMLDAIMN
jgi:hypothetical protein